MPKDIQSLRPSPGLRISRVGVKNVKKPVFIKRGKRTAGFVATLEAAVDLPAEQKGTHMSRHIETINQVLTECSDGCFHGIEYITRAICDTLLKKHTYARYAYCTLEGRYFWDNRPTVLRASTEHTRDGKVKSLLEVEVPVNVPGDVHTLTTSIDVTQKDVEAEDVMAILKEAENMKGKTREEMLANLMKKILEKGIPLHGISCRFRKGWDEYEHSLP